MRSSAGQAREGLPDDETLRLLRSRDGRFLENLFREVNPYLLRFCLASSFSREEAIELVHRAWETFFANLEKFEGRSRIRTFLCGILLNKIREHRRESKRLVPEEDPESIMESAFTPEGWWRADPPDPQRLAENRQLTSFVKECLEGLSGQQQAAFVLKEVEDESAEAVCDALGVKLGHLRVLLFRAKEKLRKCVEGKASPEEA